MSRTVTLSWDVAQIREDGKALAKSEIAYTEVTYSANGGTSFSVLAQVKPDLTQTITKDLADGTYTFRLVEIDTLGQKGKPVDVTGTVKSAPPGQVMNVKLTVS